MKKLAIVFALVFGVFTITAEAQHHLRPRPPHHVPPPHHNPPPHFDRWERDYVTCESINYNYNQCGSYYVRRIDRVRLVQQHSKTYCQQGRNWGYDRRSVWVSGGCRATFEVLGRR
jgi:hypothetical protein